LTLFDVAANIFFLLVNISEVEQYLGLEINQQVTGLVKKSVLT
jgi:hypothetical protein